MQKVADEVSFSFSTIKILSVDNLVNFNEFLPFTYLAIENMLSRYLKNISSHDVESGSDITPYNKIDTGFVTLRNYVHYNVS